MQNLWKSRLKKKEEEDKKPELDPNKPISLDFLTNPNKE